MAESERARLHLFVGSSLGLWWKLLREHGGAQRAYRGRLARILALSALTAPLRAAERLRYGRRVRRTEIAEPPLFIHGFHRSGTTHLYNLLSRDPQFGYVSTFQVLTSPFFLITRGWLERLIAGRIDSKRPGDNVAVALDLPQDVEVAFAAVSPLSPMHQVSFPSRMDAMMQKYGAMRLTPAEMRQWERAYLDVLRKTTLASDGRRLLLKSPVNLGRTGHLLRLFPDAKFVYIVRNPYTVLPSMMQFHRAVAPTYRLQDIDWDHVESAVLAYYDTMMNRYLRERDAIPKGNLVEIRFEELEADALGVLEHVYRELSLPDWETAQARIGAYAKTLTGYEKNVHQLDQRVIDKVERHWGFALREWGYSPPGGG